MSDTASRTYILSVGKHPWRAKRGLIEQAVAELGGSMDALADAITCIAGDFCTLDTHHPVWLQLIAAKLPAPPPRPTGRVRPTEPQDRWADLFCRAGHPVKNPVEEMRFITRLASGLEGFGCSCDSKWAAYFGAQPPTIETVEQYTAWAWAAQDDKRRELKKTPLLTPEEAIADRPLALHTSGSGGGMGDTIVALYAACGLAKATGRRVVYYARWCDWIDRASYPGVTIRPHHEIGVDVSGGWDGQFGYFLATMTARSRQWAYRANLATAYGVPPFAGVRPNVDRSVTRPRAEGVYAVLAPFTSAWPAREWPAERWTELAAALASAGVRPIGIGPADQRDRLSRVLPGHEYRYGIPTDEVTDLMLGAAVTIGNDSGIAHVGGLLGVPTVCVHAGSLPHEYLFESAPTVVSVVNPAGLYRGDADLPALRGVTTEQVMRTVEEILRSGTAVTPDRPAFEAASIDK